MIPTSETLYSELITEIASLAAERDTLIRTERIVFAIMTALEKLKQQIKDQGFSGDEEEILFYKQHKPKFHALYIYHATVFTVESDKPLGSTKSRIKYFRSELKRIDNFFFHNVELYKYYRSGRTHLDKEYFTRGQGFNGFMIDIVTPIIDREFCTLHSVKIAFLIAYQQLRQYFQESMLEIETAVKTPIFGPTPAPLTWTDSKTGLIELIYALHAAGSFNEGKVELKQIIDNLQAVFHVELSNPSRTFHEILARKKGYATFLRKLENALIRQINKDDD